MTIHVVLKGTTHPGNIGAAARAMKNMGLHSLRLVQPKVFPHEDATARASGAEDIFDKVQVYSELADATADCVYVAGASARHRALEWPELDARECAQTLHQKHQDGDVALLLGPEKSGLSNADLDRCNALVCIPTVEDFSSLNLAMALQVLAYELFIQAGNDVRSLPDDTPPATVAEMEYFYEHLEQVLTASRFLDPENPRILMRRLRRLFIKAEPDKNEINILRGILTSVDPRQEPSS